MSENAGSVHSENTAEYNIEQLMREYGNDVLRTAYSYVRDKYAAEDMFQETFIKAYKHLKDFNGESSIKTWLIRITINTCKDYLKSAYNQKVVPMMEFEEDALTSDSDFSEVEQEDTNKQIMKAVMELPETFREPVLMIYYQEMSVKEAAEAIGVPEGTIKSRLSRAREQLKKSLEGRL